jgi:thiol:disulfide interchange protein DsbA
MKRVFNNMFVVVTLMFALTGISCAAEYQEGKHYKRIDTQKTANPDNVEVLEFFWYGCPHCYQFEPHIKQWKKNKPANVDFYRVPATFRPLWALHARAYYALEMMGQLEKVHPYMFSEIHNNKNLLGSVDDLASFVSKHGVDRSEFVDTMNSFSVENSLRKATRKVNDYKINGVPAIAVNGKYLVTGSMAGNYDNMIKITQYLVEKESIKTAALKK